MVKSAKGASSVAPEARKVAVEAVANHIHESLGVQRQLKVYGKLSTSIITVSNRPDPRID